MQTARRKRLDGRAGSLSSTRSSRSCRSRYWPLHLVSLLCVFCRPYPSQKSQSMLNKVSSPQGMFCFQVEVKSSCVFVPSSHVPLEEPTANIPSNVKGAFQALRLPACLVLALPGVTVHSAASAHKHIDVEQDIPIRSLEHSVLGEQLFHRFVPPSPCIMPSIQCTYYFRCSLESSRNPSKLVVLLWWPDSAESAMRIRGVVFVSRLNAFAVFCVWQEKSCRGQ